MNKQKEQKETGDDLIISDTRKRKGLLAYLAMAIALTLLLGAISVMNIGISGFFIKACQILAFLGCGILYISFLKKNIVFPYLTSPFNNKLLFSISLSLLISIVLLLLYLFTDSNMIVMSFASSCSFLLPFAITEAWKTYNELPQKRYKLWYNSDVVMDSRTTVFLNSLPIRLKLSLKYFDISEEMFELTVPGHTQFGKFFNQFIIEKNKNNTSVIECIDIEKKPFGWQFYVARFNGLNKQFIDPELSLRENKVNDHSVITAKRHRTNESLMAKLPSPERNTMQKLNRNTSINKHEAGKL